MGVLAKSLGKSGRGALAAILALLALCMAASAQQRAVPESAVAMKQSFAPVVKRAAPAVVNVYVRRPAGAHPEFAGLRRPR
jgi:S1-C subfamily serine protease